MSFELRRLLVGACLVCSLGLVPERAWAQKPEVAGAESKAAAPSATPWAQNPSSTS